MNNNFKIGMQSWFVSEFLDEGIDKNSLTDELAAILSIKEFLSPEMGLSRFCEVCVKQTKEKAIDIKRIK